LIPWTALAASRRPLPPPVRYWEARNVLPIRIPFTVFGRREGFTWYRRAATPETIAPAWEVPVPLK
jgi:hypothetical protein